MPTNPWVTNHNLIRIDASNNAIDELHADAFPYPNLRYVDLSNNSIDRLNGDEFDAATRIEEINLENNQLYGVAASWHGAENLQTLQLAGNPGAPFEIPVSLDDLGGAVFQVSIDAGTPFPVTVELSATNGTLSHGFRFFLRGEHGQYSFGQLTCAFYPHHGKENRYGRRHKKVDAPGRCVAGSRRVFGLPCGGDDAARRRLRWRANVEWRLSSVRQTVGCSVTR